MYFQRIGLGFDGTGGGKYADMPCIGDGSYAFGSRGVSLRVRGGVGVILIGGKFICWMVRSALADAVLQANITSGQPNAKSFVYSLKGKLIDHFE